MDSALSMKCTQGNTDEVEAATRDGDYWFNTGDLIIVSRGVAFRVGKSLLVENSVVFRGMFAQCTPSAAGDLFDGCLVVILDDSPNDWRELFCLLYPGSGARMK